MLQEARRRRRRRHVPAFGEWNYSYADEPEACSEAWFRFSYPGPPPCKPAAAPVKARRAGSGGAAPGRERERPCDSGRGRLQEKAAVSRRSSRASDASGVAAATPARAVIAMRRPVVDADLYRVPPPDFASQRPRNRVVRSMWMGCLGLNCVP
ncbi:hypothetical protein E2562_030536 [Oryza meyeriana var. granulata]|uniref:Uncharacterized protein n=1 Tax=Oryza meyeriana var. granulata TaxID=110450 RepID=A0A6G1D8B4_9ORYZ|nr:hypothetical protein E2562_030536 [Oryza meyeriana var. granulata]